MSRIRFTLQLIQKLFPIRDLLAELTKIPVIGSLIIHLVFAEDRLHYLPKNESVPQTVSINVDKPLEEPKSVVIPSQVAEYFIRKADYIFKMDFCICRTTENCENYPHDLGCLFLGNVAKKISPEVGKQVTQEEALQHLEECREQGLINLVGKNKLDQLWLNTYPLEQFFTICNCCECCCLWRMLPNLSIKRNNPVKKIPGVKIEVSEDCIGCGSCLESCFVNAIHIKDGKAIVDESCRGCGRCVSSCPKNAIKLNIKEPRFLEKTIKNLEKVLNVSNKNKENV